jgi:HD superfamily phosphohydrolase
VWPGCAHVLTETEEAVIASPAFQRLRRLRQMGLAFHAWPNAENTRASHSLGVAYWSARYLDALRRAPDDRTRAGVAEADASLDGLSLDVVLRLFALLHDIDLLPLGHTLRYQSGLFGEPAGHPRLAACVAGIKAHAGPIPPAAFDDHLDAAAAAWGSDRSAHGRLLREIVNSGLGADLFDFALRDSFAITRPQALHGQLIGALRLVETDEGWGLALDASDPATAAGRVAMADDLYRARFEVFAASVFHPVKLAADAMLDLVLRRLGPGTCTVLLPEHRLLAMGDDELLTDLVRAEAALAEHPVGQALLAGRLHEEVWRTEDLARFRVRTDADPARGLALDPEWRTGAEAALTAAVPGTEPGDVIVAVSPPTMQAKPANARLVGPGGVVFSLADASAHGYLTEADEISRRYERLWSLRVYLARHRRADAERAAAAAAAMFGGSGGGTA